MKDDGFKNPRPSGPGVVNSGHTAARRPHFWASLALTALLAITTTGLRAAESATSSPAEQHLADIESAMTAAQKVQVKGT